MNSDERIEAAKRLREKHSERNSAGWLEAQDMNMQALNYLHDLAGCLPDGESAFTVLADLIDPTCHVRIPDEMEGECFCSECGSMVGEYGYPKYCPFCGARVVGR